MRLNDLQKQRQINEHLYKSLIYRYTPTYEGTLQPLTISEILQFQFLGRPGIPWKLIHLFWQKRYHECIVLIESISLWLKKRKLRDGRIKGHLLRKLSQLRKFCQWSIININRKKSLQQFLRETGLGRYFYIMHKIGWQWQIS